MDQVEEEEDEDEEAPAAAPKKVCHFEYALSSLTEQSKKKKPKKKKAAVVADIDESGPSTPTQTKGGKKNKAGSADPFAGMDEVDRALAELNMK